MNMSTADRVRLSVVLVAVLIAGCTRPPAPGSQTSPAGGDLPGARKVTVSQIGSTTLLSLAEKWQQGFNVSHPEVSINVAGGGTGNGLKALLDGSADIANASRAMKPEEKGQAEQKGIKPVEHVVAYDGIAVIVHNSNPIGEISIEQLADIFTGRITNWQRVGGPDRGIVLINRESSSGSYEAFKELVVTLGGKYKARDYAPEALMVQSNEAVMASVKTSAGALGYVGLGYVSASVKALKVKPVSSGGAVAGTVQTVQDGSYPLSRALYMYTNGEPSGQLKAYFDYIKSTEGQEIVKQAGHVPVPAPA